MKKVLLALAVAVMFSSLAMAATPIQLSLWDTSAIPKSDTVTGIELGIGNNLQSVTGLQWNIIWSKTNNAPLAWQLGIVNQVTGNFAGIQDGFVNFNTGNVTGLIMGAVNYSEGSNTGLQWGFINYQNAFTGLSLGFINYAKTVEGIQFGFLNYADTAKSFAIQIGLLNYLGNSSIYKIFPIINAKI